MNQFQQWATRWIDLAGYDGAELLDAEDRIEQVLALWQETIPGNWQRGCDEQLLRLRYRRTHTRGRPVAGGEHEIEHQILDPDPARTPTTCLGLPLIDGVNAFPLATDETGGRVGNVEADMLLLTGTSSEQTLLLVEVKSKSNDVWYAVVENLRQMKLLGDGAAGRELFSQRDRTLPDPLPATAVVLAPASFYSDRGKKEKALGPANQLIRAIRERFAVSVVLAMWDRGQRRIEPRHALGQR